MSIIEVILIGIGLSMDAFAVAICKGLCMPKVKNKHSIVIALFFGGFQALMPLFGWMLGKRFEKYIINIDHWVAFLLLVFIGGKMVYDACIEEKKETKVCYLGLDIRELFVLAIATSIDALAVGITFAFLRVNIYSAITIIGIITFVISLMGVYIGIFFGDRVKKKTSIAGGSILIVIGLKILIEHLFFGG